MTVSAAAFDPRTTLARPDLAEQALEGLVRAEAYRPVTAMHCAAPAAPVRAEAGGDGAAIDQLIFGEAFDVLDRRGDWCWGRARRDGVVGWIDRAALGEGAPLPAWRVSAVADALPLNALLVEPRADLGLDAVGAFERDPVAVAERLIGVPHRLGARSSEATDCAGLIQQALYACGRAAPRYADQQAGLGRAVEAEDRRRGDIVVWLKAGEAPWGGHAAFVLDEGRVLHAAARLGAVAVEAWEEADARCRADGFSAPLVRRLTP